MSSEMRVQRELLESLLKRDEFDGDCRCVNHSRKAEREYEAGKCPHQKLRALLARTEAGAYGLCAKHGAMWAKGCAACDRDLDQMPGPPDASPVADGAAMLVRDVCEMAPADPDAPDTVCIRVSDLTRIAERYTHPQDASGDAESTALYLRPYDVTMIGQAKHAGQDMVSVLAKLHPTEGWGVRFNVAAMQAKEAK